MLDFGIFTGCENIALVIELDRSLLACRDTKHQTQILNDFTVLVCHRLTT